MRKRGASGPYLKAALLLAGASATAVVLVVGAAVIGFALLVAGGVALVDLVFSQDWDVWSVARSASTAVAAIALPLVAARVVGQPRARAFNPPPPPAYVGVDYRRVWASQRRVRAAMVLAAISAVALEFIRPSAALFVSLVVGWSFCGRRYSCRCGGGLGVGWARRVAGAVGRVAVLDRVVAGAGAGAGRRRLARLDHARRWQRRRWSSASSPRRP